MYTIPILIVLFVILTVSTVFATKYIKESKNSNDPNNAKNGQNSHQISQKDEKLIKKQYNARAKVIFEERDKDFLRNAIGALEMSSVSDGELKFMEYFDQSLFFDNTRVEDCVALKLLIEKYLDLAIWSIAIYTLEKYIK